MARKWSFAALAGALAAALLAAPASAAPGILAGAVHGEGTWSYVDGSSRTFVADFGRITLADGDGINLFRADQVLVRVAHDDDTCVRLHGLPATTEDLRVGMRAVTFSEEGDGGAPAAAAIRAGRPLVRWDRPGCGLLRGAVHGDTSVTYVDGAKREFDWDRGRIIEITDSTITTVRRDGAWVTVSWDEDTRHRGHQGIEDLEVGDRIQVVSEEMGDGSLLARVIAYLA
ncbi:MAG: hypothetical protein HY658_10820 [Actinobacteria bacterium]|nr:hypothetical protein [Actinomycetota bacterium]